MSRWLHLLAAAVLGGALVLAAPTGATLAGLTDVATTVSPAPLATSGTLAAPAAPTVTASLGTVVVSWREAVATGGGGTVPASGYQVLRYTAATGTQGATQVCPATAGQSLPADARQCSVPATLTGGTYYAVVSRLATAWQRESARTQLVADLTGPTVAFTAPVQGQNPGSGQAMQNAVAPACPAGGIACGTASDPSAPVGVQYALTRRTTSGALQTTCWTGAGWDAAPLTGCADRPATVAGSAWRVPGALATAYPGNGFTFSLRITATDALGNASTSTITFSY